MLLKEMLKLSRLLEMILKLGIGHVQLVKLTILLKEMIVLSVGNKKKKKMQQILQVLKYKIIKMMIGFVLVKLTISLKELNVINVVLLKEKMQKFYKVIIIVVNLFKTIIDNKITMEINKIILKEMIGLVLNVTALISLEELSVMIVKLLKMQLTNKNNNLKMNFKIIIETEIEIKVLKNLDQMVGIVKIVMLITLLKELNVLNVTKLKIDIKAIFNQNIYNIQK